MASPVCHGARAGRRRRAGAGHGRARCALRDRAGQSVRGGGPSAARDDWRRRSRRGDPPRLPRTHGAGRRHGRRRGVRGPDWRACPRPKSLIHSGTDPRVGPGGAHRNHPLAPSPVGPGLRQRSRPGARRPLHGGHVGHPRRDPRSAAVVDPPSVPRRCVGWDRQHGSAGPGDPRHWRREGCAAGDRRRAPRRRARRA